MNAEKFKAPYVDCDFWVNSNMNQEGIVPNMNTEQMALQHDKKQFYMGKYKHVSYLCSGVMLNCSYFYALLLIVQRAPAVDH